MTDVPDTKIGRAAESVLLKLVARWSMAVIIPVILAIGGVIWGTISDSTKAINRIDNALTTLVGQNNLLGQRIEAVEKTTNNRLDAQADRITSHDKRFDRIEDRIFLPGKTP
jgi:hypothetical protein